MFKFEAEKRRRIVTAVTYLPPLDIALRDGRFDSIDSIGSVDSIHSIELASFCGSFLFPRRWYGGHSGVTGRFIFRFVCL